MTQSFHFFSLLLILLFLTQSASISNPHDEMKNIDFVREIRKGVASYDSNLNHEIDIHNLVKRAAKKDACNDLNLNYGIKKVDLIKEASTRNGPKHETKNDNLVSETCKKAASNNPNLSYEFCVTSLQVVPKSHCTNLRGLGMVSMKLIKRNATHTHSIIKKKLLKNQKTMDPFYRDCLMSCLELYDNAVYTTKNAIRYYKSKHYSEANIQISAVMDVPTTCEDGFKEKEGIVSPLTKKNEDLFELSALGLSIIVMLH